MLFWILAGVTVAILFHQLIIKPHNYWQKLGIPQTKPVLIIGDVAKQLFRVTSFFEHTADNYKQFPGKRYAGMYQLLTPVLMLRDPELIKQICVKDFDHFLDHRGFVRENIEPIFAKHLFALTAQQWKNMRVNLNPTFTSSKMRIMFGLISDCAKQFTEHFTAQHNGEITIEMKDAFTRFTNDVIATAAFGIKCDSLKDKNNEFYLMGKEITDFSGFRKVLKFFFIFLFSNWLKHFKVTLFHKRVTVFFSNLIIETIKAREKEGTVRPDMIHILLEARKSRSKNEESNEDVDTGFAVVKETSVGKVDRLHVTPITDEDIVAQSIIFFAAGFDAVSSLMCFLTYELAVHSDIQKRVHKEMDDTVTACGGKLTYESLMGMKYLDMIISQTLRKWPNNAATDRVCTKPYTIPAVRPDEKPVHFKVGDLIWLSIVGLHRDPEYYPNPEKFDPDRFNEENKLKINPYAYLPFGVGPRSCIGSRFALMETKILFFHLLTKFEIVVTSKTEIPFKIARKSLNLNAANGFWLGLKPRVT